MADKSADAAELAGPADHQAIADMYAAWSALRQLGWQEPTYAPKDGSLFYTISAGSTGIHPCHYSGGHFLVHDGNDLYPGHPVLFRQLEPGAAK